MKKGYFEKEKRNREGEEKEEKKNSEKKNDDTLEKLTYLVKFL